MTHRVSRNWLGDEMAAQLLAYAIAAQNRFKPTKVGFEGETEDPLEERARRSLMLRDLGPFAEPLRQRARRLQGELEKTFGMSHAPTAEIEMEVVAHGDGGFYHSHIDTFTAGEAAGGKNRRLTLVYYFHRQPRRFTGGHLRLFGLGASPPWPSIRHTTAFSPSRRFCRMRWRRFRVPAAHSPTAGLR